MQGAAHDTKGYVAGHQRTQNIRSQVGIRRHDIQNDRECECTCVKRHYRPYYTRFHFYERNGIKRRRVIFMAPPTMEEILRLRTLAPLPTPPPTTQQTVTTVTTTTTVPRPTQSDVISSRHFANASGCIRGLVCLFHPYCCPHYRPVGLWCPNCTHRQLFPDYHCPSTLTPCGTIPTHCVGTPQPTRCPPPTHCAVARYPSTTNDGPSSHRSGEEEEEG